MFVPLKKGATAFAAALALAVTVGLTLTESADAAKTKATIEPESLSSVELAPARGSKTKRATTAGRVCCSLRRPATFAFLKRADCRAVHGKIAPVTKCAQAGAKPSEAYFVKVDSETTTEADKPGESGPKIKQRK